MMNRIVSIFLLWIAVLSVNAQTSEHLMSVLRESIKVKDWEEMYLTAQLLIEHDPYNINGYHFSAKFWEHKGDIDSAIYYYKQCAFESKDYMDIVKLYENVGNIDMQLKYLGIAVRHERYKTPLDVQSLYDAGIVNDPDTLIHVKSFNIALKKRAALYYQLHRYDESVDDYRLIIDDGEARYNIKLAEVLVKQEKYEEAISCLAVISDKNYGYQQDLLGWFCKKKLEMLEDDMSTIDNKPEYIEDSGFYLYRAELYMQLGNQEAACKDLRIAETLGVTIEKDKVPCP